MESNISYLHIEVQRKKETIRRIARGELSVTQRRDYIKIKFCFDSGIKLLRILYTEFYRVESIIIQIKSEWRPENYM